MKEALYWKKDDNGIRCLLCPHYCFIKNNKYGICRQRKNIEGVLFSMNYGKITSCAIDPMEKKPLYHFMPGEYILSYGSMGCNFHCSFCQNYRISLDENPPAIFMTAEQIIEKALAEDLKAIAFTYNEPTVWYEFVIEAAKLAKENNIATVCVTNGFINIDPLKELIKYIDAFNVDLKSFSEDFYKKICGGKKEPVLEAIKTIYGKAHIEITTLLIENENDNINELESLFKWIASLDRGIVLHLSRYFPAYKMNNPPTKIETMIEAKKLAQKYLDNVYIGNVPGIK
jgi:pyruvate formate lyase activating enzyme